MAGFGITPVIDLPGVGRGLSDHALVSVDAAVRAEPPARPNYQTMASWRSDGGDGPPDLHLFACGPFDHGSVGEDAALTRLAGWLD